MIQIILAVIAVIPAIWLAYTGYKRSQKVDAIAEQAGIATESRESISQVIGGLKDLLDQYRVDNQVCRAKVAELEAKVEALWSEVHALGKQIASSPASQ